MAEAKQRIRRSRVLSMKWADPVACWRVACRLIIIVNLALGIPMEMEAADSYSTVVSKHLELETQGSIETKPGSTEDPQITDLKRAVMAAAESLPNGTKTAPPRRNQSTLLISLAGPLVGLLTIGGVGFLIKRRLDALVSARALAEGRSLALLEEDPIVSAFFRELRASLTLPAAAENVTANGGEAQRVEEAVATATDPLEGFFTTAPAQIAGLRKIFSEISRAADNAARQNILLEFEQQVGGLKDNARMPEVRPVWLVASALEGLLKELSKNAADVTTSVLGTAAGAVDLLEVLAVRGLNPDLATEPPVKFLAVDDDPVSRLAVSFALKKAFNPPDMAPDGQTALGLVARSSYDVIFLDVDMPGMDGYELCTEIRKIEQHKRTPIVFVTRHSDFQSRAKSTLSGGQDLIGKPFLAFEITVKALTLALRGRLQNRRAVTTPARQESKPAIAATASGPAAVVSPLSTQPAEAPMLNTTEPNGVQAQSGISTADSPNGKPGRELSNRDFQALFRASPGDSADTFLTHAPAHLGQLRAQLQAAQQATESVALQKLLGQLYVGVHAFSAQAERAELRPITRLSSALEAMLKKMSGHSKLCAPSTFAAAAAAIDLLEELCSRTETHLDLAQPVRILVVDDDPVARRGISMAVQLVFGRPENADSGEVAVALTGQKSFDLILLDVLMPGIDGFTACKQIHQTRLNRRTPVVFITGHDDAGARSKAVDAGGSGFIPKPVLSSQITLVALTFILQARLEKSKPASVSEAACLA